MSVKLRLRRLGRKQIPVYSIVAADQRKARDGRYIEDIGRYYPLREPAEVRLDEDRA
ncbi:MAG: 30S ribosomal protein S16, partial [Bacteroidetes bacterium QH_2_63_10]